MADDALNPTLRDVAEKYLRRSLTSDEESQLVNLQHGIAGNRPSTSATPDAVEQARQQLQAAIGQGKAQVSADMRSILESIQTSSVKALQVQEKEEQAILKLLESCKTLSDLRPAAMHPGLAGLQPGSQLSLTQIAGHLADLTKQEVENCFNRQFGPLVGQLNEVVQRLNLLGSPGAGKPDGTSPGGRMREQPPTAPAQNSSGARTDSNANVGAGSAAGSATTSDASHRASNMAAEIAANVTAGMSRLIGGVHGTGDGTFMK